MNNFYCHAQKSVIKKTSLFFSKKIWKPNNFIFENYEKTLNFLTNDFFHKKNISLLHKIIRIKVKHDIVVKQLHSLCNRKCYKELNFAFWSKKKIQENVYRSSFFKIWFVNNCMRKMVNYLLSVIYLFCLINILIINTFTSERLFMEEK